MKQSLDSLLRLMLAQPVHLYVFVPVFLILLVFAGIQFFRKPVDHKKNVTWLLIIAFFLAIWATIFWVQSGQ